VLIVEDWAEIRRLRKSEGVSISEIARLIGCSRNTVKAALASDEPPRYERARSGSLADVYDPRIRELLTAFPRMPATVIAERIEWPYSIRTLSTRVAELRPIYLPPDPPRAPAIWPGRSPSVISGSRRSGCRSGLGRSAPHPSYRC
jgi:transposase